MEGSAAAAIGPGCSAGGGGSGALRTLHCVSLNTMSSRRLWAVCRELVGLAVVVRRGPRRSRSDAPCSSVGDRGSVSMADGSEGGGRAKESRSRRLWSDESFTGAARSTSTSTVGPGGGCATSDNDDSGSAGEDRGDTEVEPSNCRPCLLNVCARVSILFDLGGIASESEFAGAVSVGDNTEGVHCIRSGDMSLGCASGWFCRCSSRAGPLVWSSMASAAFVCLPMA